MNKNLPGVFAVPINKKIDNNEDTFISSRNEDRGEKINKQDINKIFNAKDHVYKTKVILTMRNNESKEVFVVGLKDNNLLTLDGQVINISDIQEIRKV